MAGVRGGWPTVRMAVRVVPLVLLALALVPPQAGATVRAPHEPPNLGLLATIGPVGTKFPIVGISLGAHRDIALVITTEEGGIVATIPLRTDGEGDFRAAYDSTGARRGYYRLYARFADTQRSVIDDFDFFRFAVGSRPVPDELYCFDEGGCLHGLFLLSWREHGGLALNGLPISPVLEERLEDGRIYFVQYCERTRLEYHPENAAPNDLLLGQFGRRLHPADPRAPRLAGARYFAETGHNLSDDFRAYWERNGGLAQFGYPISEAYVETLEDGKMYYVQYFERARFEYHPENKAPYTILLGQFGRRILDADGDRR
jgi:hypothetical protein